jgi:predicted acylesterase/phospholipase RssA
MSAEPEANSSPIAPSDCDIIMKGGITSGVVYPLAVCELKETYRFRNIGGTSAGAIAAALTAAAELGRDTSTGGFQTLKQLPDILQVRLLSLFQPAPETRPAFEVLLAWTGGGKGWRKYARSVAKSVLLIARFHFLWLLLGLMLGAAIVWGIGALVSADPARWQAWIVGGILAVICGLILAFVGFGRQAWTALNGNGFGLCNGFQQIGKAEPLTPWLANLLNVAAGRSPLGPPLTFGHLWGGEDPEELKEQERDPRRRKINLEVMTTNLTHGTPLRIPFMSRNVYFDPQEFRKYFPEEVVQWMETHPSQGELRNRIARETRFKPFPDPVDLPVIVAARMSLSFPLLISAVPLYAVDFSLPKNKGKVLPELERCWFSDGGIGSNFPVHFFDGFLPSRPTFGINLRPFHPSYPQNADESKNVHFPIRSGDEVAPTWTPISNSLQFLLSIVGTMQNWVDNTQMRLPGYRDRVVHIHLDGEKEGGLNLNMEADLIQALTKRGQAAGRALTDFNWDGHRWTRYITLMAQLHDKLERMRFSCDEGFLEFLDRYDSGQAPYRRKASWKKAAGDRTRRLMKEIEDWAESESFKDDPPKPEPELRLSARR